LTVGFTTGGFTTGGTAGGLTVGVKGGTGTFGTVVTGGCATPTARGIMAALAPKTE
jgi:hypothetical protein